MCVFFSFVSSSICEDMSGPYFYTLGLSVYPADFYVSVCLYLYVTRKKLKCV